jgi:DNA-directed RNA polymerase subunit RPC12/RpoP
MIRHYPCSYCGKIVERKRRMRENENVRCQNCTHILEKKQRQGVSETRIVQLAALYLELVDKNGTARDVPTLRLRELKAEFERWGAAVHVLKCERLLAEAK